MASNILRTPYVDRQTSETRECSVCLNERVDPCRTSCGHFFCEECLRAALKPWNRGRCPLCRSKVSLYDTVKADLTTPLEKPAVDTIFGSAFLQNGRPGVAAYHFDSIEDCYISYENAPSSWKLDNGESPPAVKPFDSPLWDAASRTFTGVVDWSPTTFGGDARWEYTIVFSEDFRHVSGGEVRAFDAAGEPKATHRYGHHLHYKLYVEEMAQLLNHLRDSGEPVTYSVGRWRR